MAMDVVQNSSIPTHQTAASTAQSSSNIEPTAMPKVEPANIKLESDSSSPAEDANMTLEQAITKLQEFVQGMQRDLNFSVDAESGRTVVKVIDSSSDEVVRQIPSETVLSLARNLERIKGALFEDKA